jgi:hypothetical protein
LFLKYISHEQVRRIAGTIRTRDAHDLDCKCKNTYSELSSSARFSFLLSFLEIKCPSYAGLVRISTGQDHRNGFRATREIRSTTLNKEDSLFAKTDEKEQLGTACSTTLTSPSLAGSYTLDRYSLHRSLYTSESLVHYSIL